MAFVKSVFVEVFSILICSHIYGWEWSGLFSASLCLQLSFVDISTGSLPAPFFIIDFRILSKCFSFFFCCLVF